MSHVCRSNIAQHFNSLFLIKTVMPAPHLARHRVSRVLDSVRSVHIDWSRNKFADHQANKEATELNARLVAYAAEDAGTFFRHTGHFAMRTTL